MEHIPQMPAEGACARVRTVEGSPGLRDGGDCFPKHLTASPSSFLSHCGLSDFSCMCFWEDRWGDLVVLKLGFLEKGPWVPSSGRMWTGRVFYGVWGSPTVVVSVKCQEAKLV